jgi:Na+-transporting NADH:ubiquinone oxidoreductase subunit A
MPEHVIKRGLNIPVRGAASGEPQQLELPETVAYAPTEFRGVVPRLIHREGVRVKRGTPIFHDKQRSDIVFVSPVSGVVKEIRRGHRRVITDYVIQVDGDEKESFQSFSLGELKTVSREIAHQALLASGLWMSLRTRPLNKVADPSVTPQSILVSGFETGPLQPGAGDLIAPDDRDALQAGIYALKALTDGPVCLTVGPDGHSALTGLDGVELHKFSGPHPAGDPSVQVSHCCPPRGDNVVWWTRAWDLLEIGRLLLSGEFPNERIYAAVGDGVQQPRFVKTLLGAPLQDIVGVTHERSLRWIRGSVLTGEAVESDRWASYYTRAVHLLPDEAPQRLFGWALPSMGVFSFHRLFLSGFSTPKGAVSMNTAVNGGHRAIVPIGVYNKVVATPDILPNFLFKSILAGDLAEALELGLLDLSEEEAALCTYVCPSKIEFGPILRQGLELYEREA